MPLWIVKWWKPALAIGLMAASAGAGWMVNGWRWAERTAQIQLDHASEARQRDRATLVAMDALITENSRRYAAVESERETAQKAATAARADAAGQRAAAVRLRQRAERMVADAVARNPSLAAGGSATGTAFDMLAHVLGRAIDAAGQLAEFADQSRNAGLTCQRIYGAVKGASK